MRFDNEFISIAFSHGLTTSRVQRSVLEDPKRFLLLTRWHNYKHEVGGCKKVPCVLNGD